MSRIALAGDTMLGRKVAERLEQGPPEALFGRDLLEVLSEADHVLVNLECCISRRGEPWPTPGKPFFFRAPPQAVDALALLGVDCVTLANNHALDFGEPALVDTLELLDRAGIARVGAGRNAEEAWAPAHLDVAGARLAVLGFTDHPADFAVTAQRSGVAYADLSAGVRQPLRDRVGELAGAEAGVLVLVHWGPNMVASPVRSVRAAAAALRDSGASLVAGHSAHVFHGVSANVLFDMGDFIDDYAVHQRLRNDLGLLWLLDLVDGVPQRVEAVPLKLDFCHTRLADPTDARWVRDRFRAACRDLGTDVAERDGRLVVDLPGGRPG